MRRDYVSRFFPCLWVNHTTNSLLVTKINVVIPYSRLQRLRPWSFQSAILFNTVTPCCPTVASTETCFYGLMRGADPYS